MNTGNDVTAGSLLELPLGANQHRNAALPQAPPAPHPGTPLTVITSALGGATDIRPAYSRINCASTMANERRSEALETCWRVIEGSTARILTCAVVNVSTSAFELRVGYLLDVPLHSERVADIHAARTLAQHWLNAMRGGTSPRNLRNWNVDSK